MRRLLLLAAVVLATVAPIQGAEAAKPLKTRITAGPDGPTAEATATFRFKASKAAAGFTCKLDQKRSRKCRSPKSFRGLADGPHVLVVTAFDRSGHRGRPARRSFTVDTTPPDTSISGGPPAGSAVASTDASFTFGSTEAASRFECGLDAAPLVSCEAARTFSGIADGSHAVSVRACDAVGNCDPTPATRSWVVDTTPPDTVIGSGPDEGATSAESSPVFSFSGTGTASRFECALDGAPFDVCSSPRSYLTLPDGPHTFVVRACNAVAGCDPTPAARAWTIDTTAPTTTIDSGPVDASLTSNNDPTFTFSADPAAGSSFECALDQQPFSACSSPTSFTDVADGSRTFQVRACDAVGNCDPTPASRTWTVDTTAPDTSISSGPSGPTIQTSATFTYSWTSSLDFAGVECQLDGGAYAPCPTGGQFYGLVAKAVVHTFRVRACDTLHNCDPTPPARIWTSTPDGVAANNETGVAAEADFCNISFPASATASPGQLVTVFGRIFEAGVTPAQGGSPEVVAQVGIGPAGTDPRGSLVWTWADAFFNVQSLDDDEYHGGFTAPADPGIYAYATRFSLDDGDGATATYCDTDGAGSGPGLSFSVASLGQLTVN